MVFQVMAVLLVLASIVMPGAASAQSPAEGIQVRGRWVLQARNPDGTVVLRREVDNAFTGASGLAALVLGDSVSGGMFLTVRGNNNPFPPLSGAELLALEEPWPGWGNVDIIPAARCADPVNCRPDSPLRTNLRTERVPAGITLSGSVRALRSTEIGFVGGSMWSCEATTAASTCGSTSRTSFQFSFVDIAPFAVEAGQLLEVNVTYSFVAMPHAVPPSE